MALAFLEDNPEYDARAAGSYLPDPLKGKKGCGQGTVKPVSFILTIRTAFL